MRMIIMSIGIIIMMIGIYSNIRTYRYNLFYHKKYKIIKEILSYNVDEFKLEYNYGGFIKIYSILPDDDIILYGKVHLGRASIFKGNKCVVSDRCTESKKIFKKFFSKYLDNSK